MSQLQLPAQRVTRVYRVTLMPDRHTRYDPFLVRVSLSAVDADRLDPTSSRATSAAFRRAIDVERSTHHTPTERRFLCGASEFVSEWSTPAPRERAPRAARAAAPTKAPAR